MPDKKYKIRWFKNETTYKEEFRNPEIRCPTRVVNEPVTSRNIISFDRPNQSKIEGIDIVEANTIDGFNIRKQIPVPNDDRTYMIYDPKTLVSTEEILRKKLASKEEKIKRIEKSKYSVHVSDMKEMENFPTLVKYIYKGVYQHDYDKDFVPRECIYSLEDDIRRQKLGPYNYSFKQKMDTKLMPIIEAWKNLQPRSLANAKSHAKPSGLNLPFPRKRDLDGCEFLMEAHRQGVLTNQYEYIPQYGGAKPRSPPYPEDKHSVYRDYHEWHTAVDMPLSHTISRLACGKLM